MDKVRVGRLAANGQVKPAFTLRRADDGGIHISGISETGITDSERHALFVHFGSPKTGRTGGFEKGLHFESIDTLKPGTQAHFLRAVYSLPKPFVLIGGE